jgi:hypothetical protein
MTQPVSYAQKLSQLENEMHSAAFSALHAIGRTDLTIHDIAQKFPDNVAVKAYIEAKRKYDDAHS